MVWITRALTLMILIEAFLILLIGFAWIIRMLWNELNLWGWTNERKNTEESGKDERSNDKEL